MYKKILIANDGSELSDKAVDAGAALGKITGAEMVVLHMGLPMVQPTAFIGEAYVGLSEEEYNTEVQTTNAAVDEKTAEIAARHGVELKVLHLIAAEPWRAIIEQATELECDAIVMASHGRGPIKALLLGSDTIAVLSHCKLPVLVVR